MDLMILVELHHQCEAATHSSALMGKESRKKNAGLLTTCKKVDCFPDSIFRRRQYIKILRGECSGGGNITYDLDFSSLKGYHGEFFRILIFFNPLVRIEFYSCWSRIFKDSIIQSLEDYHLALLFIFPCLFHIFPALHFLNHNSLSILSISKPPLVRIVYQGAVAQIVIRSSIGFVGVKFQYGWKMFLSSILVFCYFKVL